MTNHREIPDFHRYNPGSTAYEAAPEYPRPRGKLPKGAKPAPKRERVLRVDVLALVSIGVALTMLAVMVTGVVRYQGLLKQEQILAEQITRDTRIYDELCQRYHSSLDLASIQARALEAGYVPLEEVAHVTISAAPEPQPQEPGVWQMIKDFLGELFA